MYCLCHLVVDSVTLSYTYDLERRSQRFFKTMRVRNGSVTVLKFCESRPFFQKYSYSVLLSSECVHSRALVGLHDRNWFSFSLCVVLYSVIDISQNGKWKYCFSRISPLRDIYPVVVL